MGWIFRFSVLIFLPVLLMTSGCASKKEQQKQINALQAQVAVITDELVRLDQSLQDLRSAVQTKASQPASAAAASGALGNIYRTPSGFQLPAVDIQKALKNAGYYAGAIDGKIGGQSEAAIRDFQRDNGLAVDGVVGRQTWEKLKVYLSGPIK